MWLPVLLAAFGLSDVAAPDREAAVIEACSTWRAGLDAEAAPQTRRVEPDGLCFSGRITTESSAAFVAAVAGFDPATPLVVVLTSGGGEVNAGMAMGEALVPRTTTVVAQRTCLSSCANYPFLAGDRRVIGPGALLGYHGGIPDMPEQYWTDMRGGFSQRMSGDELERSMKSSRDAYDVQVNRQDAFLKSVDVDVNLFRWMAGNNSLSADEWLASCPVPDAVMMVFSEAVLAERGIVIHENGGSGSDAELAAALDERGATGMACYWD